jgi:small nuclear ribonucleoprotein (snRNP)-like protein
MAFAFGAAAAVVLLVLVYVLRYRVPYRAKRTVIVHTKDGHSLQGALGAVYPGALVLKGAREQLDDSHAAELVGDILVERSNLSFVQVVDR